MTQSATAPTRPPLAPVPQSERRLGMAVVAVTMVLFVILSWGRFTAPFGHSHDGRNGGTWASGSRSLRELGPVDSRLGSVSENGSTYANHPPLLVWTMAGSEATFGEHPWASRLPVLLSTLAAIALLYAVGRNARFRPLPLAAGIVGGFLSPMALTYGSMPDTPMLSLGLGVAVVLLWQRMWAGQRVAPVLVAGIWFAAVLSGWEAAFLSGLAASALVWQGWRRQDQRCRRGGIAALAATAVGAATVIGWAWWSYGTGSVLTEQLLKRSGSGDGATPSLALSNQVHWLTALFGVALLGLGLAVAALILDPPRRSLFGLLLAATFGYTTLLHNGAVFHDYWNYWFVIPVVLGLAWGLERVCDAVERRHAPAAASLVVVVGGMVLLGIVGVTASPEPLQSGNDGARPGRLVTSATIAADARTVADIGETYGAGSWLTYETRLPHEHLFTLEELAALARSDPNAPVLLNEDCGDGSGTDLCRAAWGAAATAELGRSTTGWRLVAAAALLDQLDAREG